MFCQALAITLFLFSLAAHPGHADLPQPLPRALYPFQSDADAAPASKKPSILQRIRWYLNPLEYHGGPVIENLKVTLIAWGSNVPDLDTYEAFYNGITKSSWFDVLKQYSTGSYTIGDGSYVGKYIESNPPNGTTIDDLAIKTYLTNLVTSGTISPNNNSYYALYFPPGINVTIQGFDTCSVDLCTYLSTMEISSLPGVTTDYLFYAVIPYLGGSCAKRCQQRYFAPVTDNTNQFASILLATMVVDPGVVQSGISRGWYNRRGEIADICGSLGGQVVGRDQALYAVNYIYSNQQRTCVLG